MTDNDIILTQGTRILTPTEYEKLRSAMLTEDQHDLIKRWTAERDILIQSGSPGDLVAASTLISKINRMMRYQICCDMYLHTGMRIVEAKNLKTEQYRPSRRVIAEVTCKKEKCLRTTRTVMLSIPGCDAVDRYLTSNVSLPEDRVSAREALIRYAAKAGIGTKGITTKMFRKTLASWLMACFPEKEMYISASMGHSRDVLQKHYLGHGFPRGEVEKMRVYLKGWGTNE